ncbi:MAG: ATP-binding cassette domain-containing protein [Devosiaceae bacterium]|nr:ATP-binding cassette domain-containing protein [Devosiaceae bacterium MH13]
MPSSAPTDTIVSCDGLHKAYTRDVKVLKGVTLSISPGERVGLIGANGAGKSTLLKSLVGLHPVTDGSVNTLGEAFSGSPSGPQRRRMRQRIGFVFQQHGLVRRLTALSNVVQGLLGIPGHSRAILHSMAAKADREAAMAALEAVNLGGFALRRADQLSGGQSQRVAIARALVRQPDLFIADEPAASLDPAAGHEVMQQFATLAQNKGITLVFTSHDMEHALTYADRVIALKDGRIAIDAPSDDLTLDDLHAVFGDSAHRDTKPADPAFRPQSPSRRPLHG